MFTRKSFQIVAVVLLILIGAALQAGNPVLAGNQSPGMTDSELEEINPENLEKFLDGYAPAQMESSHVPGLIITIIKGGEVLISKGYGYSDLENQIPMTPQTTIRAGSVSKSILSTTVLQLVAQGALDLNAPVSEYINDLDLDDEFGPASTVQQLLTHMGGYPDNLLLSHSPDLDGWEPLGDVLQSDLPPRAFAPGLVSAYSDWNFSLLGYAIEGATGKPYEVVMEERLFTPLGMESTTYAQPLPQEIAENLALGYGWNYSKYRYDIVPHDFVRMSPGIALVTNGQDMGSFMIALLDGGRMDGNQVFDEETLEMLLSRQGSAHPYSRGWSYGFVENTISGRKVLYKDGNGIGFSSRIVLIPDQDLGIFISTNHRNLGKGLWLTQAAAMATRTLVAEILERFVPEAEIEIPDVSPISNRAERISRFTGHYQKAGIARNDFFKLEGLLDNVNVKDNGDGTLRIGSGIYQEVEPLVFQNIESPGFFVIFVENPSGEVEFLTFGGTGSYQRAPWYQAKNTHIFLAGIIALISLAMLIAWPITRHCPRLAWVVSLLNLGFIVGVGLMFVPSVTDLLIFFKTIPLGVKILFVVPWVTGILSLSLLALPTVAWKDHKVTLWGRIHYFAVTVSSIALVWMAYFWNLILR